MNTKPLNFILIGRSGSGKGTQAEFLAKDFHLLNISSGDLMRDVAGRETDVGKRVKKILAEGGLVPEVIADVFWINKIAYELNEDQGFLLDGTLRRLDEAERTDRFIDFLERKVSTKILLVEISHEEAFKRLKLRGRHDDTDENINERLDWFDQDVMPVVKYFESQGRLIRINGEQSVEDVYHEILLKVNEVTT